MLCLKNIPRIEKNNIIFIYAIKLVNDVIVPTGLLLALRIPTSISISFL